MRTNRESRRSKGSRAAIALVATLLACGASGCRFSPYAPAREPALAPPGESVPVPSAGGNPLDAPAVLERVCTPQGQPVTVDDETRRCDEDDACRIECVTREDAIDARVEAP